MGSKSNLTVRKSAPFWFAKASAVVETSLRFGSNLISARFWDRIIIPLKQSCLVFTNGTLAETIDCRPAEDYIACDFKFQLQRIEQVDEFGVQKVPGSIQLSSISSNRRFLFTGNDDTYLSIHDATPLFLQPTDKEVKSNPEMSLLYKKNFDSSVTQLQSCFYCENTFHALLESGDLYKGTLQVGSSLDFVSCDIDRVVTSCPQVQPTSFCYWDHWVLCGLSTGKVIVITHEDELIQTFDPSITFDHVKDMSVRSIADLKNHHFLVTFIGDNRPLTTLILKLEGHKGSCAGTWAKVDGLLGVVDENAKTGYQSVLSANGNIAIVYNMSSKLIAIFITDQQNVKCIKKIQVVSTDDQLLALTLLNLQSTGCGLAFQICVYTSKSSKKAQDGHSTVASELPSRTGIATVKASATATTAPNLSKTGKSSAKAGLPFNKKTILAMNNSTTTTSSSATTSSTATTSSSVATSSSATMSTGKVEPPGVAVAGSSLYGSPEFVTTHNLRLFGFEYNSAIFEELITMRQTTRQSLDDLREKQQKDYDDMKKMQQQERSERMRDQQDLRNDFNMEFANTERQQKEQDENIAKLKKEMEHFMSDVTQKLAELLKVKVISQSNTDGYDISTESHSNSCSPKTSPIANYSVGSELINDGASTSTNVASNTSLLPPLVAPDTFRDQPVFSEEDSF